MSLKFGLCMPVPGNLSSVFFLKKNLPEGLKLTYMVMKY